MLVFFFNYFSELFDINTDVPVIPTMNIYQFYVMAVLAASICAMGFNMFCARIELDREWDSSSFFFNRWTVIYMCLIYSGLTLCFLMFFIPNPLILWRIYQVINFFLIAFLDLARVESIFNYYADINNQFEKFLK
jgi:hypothetical protein